MQVANGGPVASERRRGAVHAAEQRAVTVAPYNLAFVALSKTPMQIDPTLFKAYDIRGIVGKNVDETFAEHLGRAFGSEAVAAGEKAVAVCTQVYFPQRWQNRAP